MHIAYKYCTSRECSWQIGKKHNVMWMGNRFASVQNQILSRSNDRSLSKLSNAYAWDYVAPFPFGLYKVKLENVPPGFLLELRFIHEWIIGRAVGWNECWLTTANVYVQACLFDLLWRKATTTVKIFEWSIKPKPHFFIHQQQYQFEIYFDDAHTVQKEWPFCNQTGKCDKIF